MNNTFSLEQIGKAGDLYADLIMRQCRLDKMAKFIEMKSINPRLKQSELARELKKSFSTLQRYRREINMLSPYGTPPSSNIHMRKQNTSNHIEHALKTTSIDLKMNPIEPVKYKIKFKRGYTKR